MSAQNEPDSAIKVDLSLLDQYIARIDEVLSQQLDGVLHHDDFQRCESAWRAWTT